MSLSSLSTLTTIIHAEDQKKGLMEKLALGEISQDQLKAQLDKLHKFSEAYDLLQHASQAIEDRSKYFGIEDANGRLRAATDDEIKEDINREYKKNGQNPPFDEHGKVKGQDEAVRIVQEYAKEHPEYRRDSAELLVKFLPSSDHLDQRVVRRDAQPDAAAQGYAESQPEANAPTVLRTSYTPQQESAAPAANQAKQRVINSEIAKEAEWITNGLHSNAGNKDPEYKEIVNYMRNQLDTNRDGIVSGQEIKDSMLEVGFKGQKRLLECLTNNLGKALAANGVNVELANHTSQPEHGLSKGGFKGSNLSV